MSIIFFLWFWSMELIAIGTISVIVGLIFTKTQEQINEEE